MLYLLNDPRSTIHRILHPNPRPIDADPEKLNNHFATIAERLTGREGKSHDDLIQIINDMPCVVGEEFLLRNVTYKEVQQELLRVRKDCSTGYAIIYCIAADAYH